ncbi:Uncharacterized protein TCAP_00016 [Tolypocladium capitatum]|uniref:alpha-galactosidase n=1 Tax=Tolypocladium capitatum TaxID=45235 RepID=A0A2K3QRA8_9HYPO|nr:Uncharacterized protein TCAP_00016 [Tolypocladium capitatum]
MEPVSEQRGYEAKKAAWPLWKKLAGAALVTILVLAVAHNGGDSNEGSAHYRRDTFARAAINSTSRSIWRPKVGATWQIMLSVPLDPNKAISPDVDVYDLDMHLNNATAIKRLHDAGKKVICYFSAGSYENWRDDKGDFKPEDLGNGVVGWPGEWWLQLSSPNVRKIMAKRVKFAADLGCDAIDPDNMDGYQNDNGLGLTAQDSISFVSFLTAEAAKYHMSTGLKNSANIVTSLVDTVDFAVNEECAAHSECQIFSAFIQAGKPVFHIEYPDGAPDVESDTADTMCNPSGGDRFSTVMKLLTLNAWVEYCNGAKYN